MSNVVEFISIAISAALPTFNPLVPSMVIRSDASMSNVKVSISTATSAALPIFIPLAPSISIVPSVSISIFALPLPLFVHDIVNILSFASLADMVKLVVSLLLINNVPFVSTVIPPVPVSISREVDPVELPIVMFLDVALFPIDILPAAVFDPI